MRVNANLEWAWVEAPIPELLRVQPVPVSATWHKQIQTSSSGVEMDGMKRGTASELLARAGLSTVAIPANYPVKRFLRPMLTMVIRPAVGVQGAGPLMGGGMEQPVRAGKRTNFWPGHICDWLPRHFQRPAN